MCQVYLSAIFHFSLPIDFYKIWYVIKKWYFFFFVVDWYHCQDPSFWAASLLWEGKSIPVIFFYEFTQVSIVPPVQLWNTEVLSEIPEYFSGGSDIWKY